MQPVTFFLVALGALALVEARVVDIFRSKRSPYQPSVYPGQGFQQRPGGGFPGGYNNQRPVQFGGRPGGHQGFQQPGFGKGGFQQPAYNNPGFVGPNRQPSFSGSQSSSNSQSLSGGGRGGQSGSQSSSSSQSFSSGGRGGLSGSSSQSSSSSLTGGAGGRRPGGAGSNSQSSSSSNSFSSGK